MWTKRALRQNSPLPAHCISIQSLQETLGELRDISADADRGSEEPKQGTKKYRAFLRSWEEPEIVGRSGDHRFFKLPPRHSLVSMPVQYCCQQQSEYSMSPLFFKQMVSMFETLIIVLVFYHCWVISDFRSPSQFQ